MRTLILCLSVLLLSACATPPTTPLAAHAAGSGIGGFATIARWGTYEMELAPAYTRLAVLRHNAAQAFSRGRINLAIAVRIQTIGDDARTQLDAARRGYLDVPTDAQRAHLAAALALIAQGEERLLEPRP